MIKRIFLWIVLVLCFGMVRAQNDTVLMRVGGMPVTCAEFLQAYHKNGAGESLHDFLTRFVDLKLQVCEAQAEGLDTTAIFRQRYDACRQALEARLKSSVGRKTSVEKGADVHADDEWVAHVCVRVPQCVSSFGMNAVREKLDSLAWMAAAGRLTDWIYAHADSLPEGWQAEVVRAVPDRMPGDLLYSVQRLKPGEMAGPLLSPVGLHLIQRLESNVERTQQMGGQEEMESPSLVLKEYHDGLLVGLLEDKFLQADEHALKKFYKRHKKHYRWKLPHFKGIVLQADDKEKLSRLAKYLKGFPQEEWTEAVARFDSIGGSEWLKAEYGLYQIGTNDCIDKYYFGQGDFTPSEEYPYVCVLGKVLKRKPDSYKDIHARLVQDYRAACLKEALQKWTKKFGVEINEEALKTVNNHDAI